jgi:hypothetical protein
MFFILTFPTDQVLLFLTAGPAINIEVNLDGNGLKAAELISRIYMEIWSMKMSEMFRSYGGEMVSGNFLE